LKKYPYFNFGVNIYKYRYVYTCFKEYVRPKAKGLKAKGLKAEGITTKNM